MIINLISFFTGFFLSNTVGITVANLEEWNLTSSALIIATIELFNNIFYNISKKYYTIGILVLLNYLKTGLIYGLIVDAFKVGS